MAMWVSYYNWKVLINSWCRYLKHVLYSEDEISEENYIETQDILRNLQIPSFQTTDDKNDKEICENDFV